MSCDARYAEAWQFAGFWCLSSVTRGADDSGGAANVSLQDSSQHFVTDSGIKANVGMVLYNLTADTSGEVTAVTETTMTATGVTWDDGDLYRIVAIDQNEIAQIELYLDIAASDIHAALAASGACDCTLASWAHKYLEKLNIIDAAAYYQCPCAKPNITDDMRQAYLDWASNQLNMLIIGKLDVCQDATGSDFPAIGWAEQSLTDFATAEIILNRRMRES